jgi:hypothetical protein
LDESIERYFLTGEVQRNTLAWEIHVNRFFDGGKKRKAAWLEHREFLLRKWRGEKLNRVPWAVTELEK